MSDKTIDDRLSDLEKQMKHVQELFLSLMGDVSAIITYSGVVPTKDDFKIVDGVLIPKHNKYTCKNHTELAHMWINPNTGIPRYIPCYECEVMSDKEVAKKLKNEFLTAHIEPHLMADADKIEGVV